MFDVTRRLLAFAFGSAAVLLSGCAMGPAAMESGTGLQGSIHGGQQPIGGVTLQVYTVGTGGDGSAATPLFTAAVTSTPSGNFTFPAYTCPSPTALTYLVGTGGNPGLATGTNNQQIGEMAVLGPCSGIATSFISVNEQTTVAAVYALAPYMSSPAAVGSGSGDASGLASAFALATEYVSSATGKTPGTNIPSGYTDPVAQIATVADIMATCINSGGGVAGDKSACGNFLSLTTPTGVTPPTDTIDALLNLAKNSALNTSQLFAMASSTAPYQPSDTVQPADFSIGLVPSTTMSLTPANTLYLPTAGPGSSSQGTATLMNTGTAALNVTGIAIGGSYASDYTQTNNCGTSLAASASCSIVVTFAPTALGSAYATLTVATTATNTPLSITLSGYSENGQLTLSPTSVNLPASPVGTASTAQPVTLTNVGSAGIVTLGAIAITGGTGDFSQTNNCPSTLAVNASCTIMVNVTPSATGTRSGTLTVASNSSFQAPTATLTGMGTAPASGTLVPSTPALFVAYPYTGFVDLTNQGATAIAISSITATQFTQTNNCGTSLAAGASCAIAVTPSALEYSLTTGSLTINNSSSVPQLTVALYTVGNFYSTNYGTVAIGSSSQVAFSAEPYELVSFSGVNATDFVGGACYNKSGYCTVTSEFVPEAVGSRVANLLGQSTTTAVGFGLAAGTAVETITSNPATLSFPQTALKAVSASQTMTIANPLGHLLNFGVGTSLTNGTIDYQISPTLCGATSCTVTVVFAPLSVTPPNNEYASYLQVYDSATNLSTNFTLSGYGGISVLTFNPSELDFGPVTVGSTSASKTFSVNDTGDSPAYLSFNFPSGPTTGTGGSDFISYSFLATVSAGTPYTTYPYSFAPTGLGNRNASVTVTDSRSGMVLGTYLLTGTGIAFATLTAVPTTLNLGTITVGAASTAQIVTISNGGSLTATFGTIGITGTNAGDFSQTNKCPATLPVGASCSFAIVFTPGSAAARSATLSIGSNDPNSPLLVQLSGTGTTSTPALSFSSTVLTFASGPVGAPSAAQTITVQNTGGATAIFGDMTIGGTNANDFSQQSNCNTLAPGASCSIQLVATPDATGSLSGTLSVPSNVGSPQAITLNATGTTPATGGVTISPSTISFTDAGTNVDVTLTNNNSATLAISNIAVSNSNFVITSTTCGTTLLGGASCVITVSSTFTQGCNGGYACPGSPYRYSGSLIVTDNGGTGFQTVSLSSANVMSVGIAGFANTAVGSQTTAKVSVVGYEHEEEAYFQGTITGANASDFTPSPAGCNGTGGPPLGQSCNFTITFKPTGVGVRTAKLTGAITGVGYILLTGTGTGAGAAFNTSPSSVSTSPQYSSGVATATVPVTLTNTGTTTLTFPSTPIYSSVAPDFSTSSNCGSVPASGSCTVEVTFTASGTATTTYTGSLVLTDSTSGMSQTIPITATATAGSH